MERRLIAACLQDREAFTTVLSAGLDEDLTDQAKVLWKLVKEYYGNDPRATHIDVEVLKSKLTREQPKHKDLFIDYLSYLEEVSTTNIMKEAIEVKLAAARQRLATAFASGKDNEVGTLLEHYNNLKAGELNEEHTTVEVFVGTPVNSIVEDTDVANRIGILPATLNSQIKGGVLRKHHIVVFAPTDMGKSLFGLNMAYGFVKQGLAVLYCGNEDPAKDMINRFLWRCSGMTEEEMRKDPEKAEKIAVEKGYHNFIFAEMAPGAPGEIEHLIKEHSPDVVMVDQIRNLDMGMDNRVLQLEAAASFMRRMGKTYNLVPVSFTQAGDSATGKALLGRGDIDFSNVGIPSTADLLLGIGATEDMENNGERMISFVKNKVSGKKMPLKVWFNPLLTKVE